MMSELGKNCTMLAAKGDTTSLSEATRVCYSIRTLASKTGHSGWWCGHTYTASLILQVNRCR